LKDAARSMGLTDRVHFLGNLPHEELPSIFAATHMVLGTSFANETFGMTLAEASACGRPVIATNFGGFPEVVCDGETGLLVPPRDPARLAAAIDAIINDPVGAARMGEAGRAFVTAEFAWPKVTERVIAAYAEALHAD
jgi:D-inositol-3-phosphate glycosyltransferase